MAISGRCGSEMSTVSETYQWVKPQTTPVWQGEYQEFEKLSPTKDYSLITDLIEFYEKRGWLTFSASIQRLDQLESKLIKKQFSRQQFLFSDDQSTLSGGLDCSHEELTVPASSKFTNELKYTIEMEMTKTSNNVLVNANNFENFRNYIAKT